MCIIIQKEAGFTIPKDKFLTAYSNNPHGWGFAVPDGKGVLTVHKEVEGETTPEELYDLIHSDEYANDPMMIHLRYTTAGETIIRNSHPFPILEFGPDGADVRMAHNGTIHKYKPTYQADNKWESDTRVFVREFVRPLFKRLSLGMSSREILNDAFVQKMLSDAIPATSVLAFIDGFGNSMQVNGTGNGGEYEDGWWYSNKYSFRDNYRTPHSSATSSASGNTSSRGGASVYDSGYYGWGDDEWDEYIAQQNQRSKGYMVGKPGAQGAANNQPGTGGDQSSAATNTGTSERQQAAPVKDLKAEREERHALDTKTARFSEKYDITDPEELYSIGDDWIELIADEAPDDLILLVKELLNDNYILNRANQGMTKKLKDVQSEVAYLRKEMVDNGKAA